MDIKDIINKEVTFNYNGVNYTGKITSASGGRQEEVDLGNGRKIKGKITDINATIVFPGLYIDKKEFVPNPPEKDGPDKFDYRDKCGVLPHSNS